MLSRPKPGSAVTVCLRRNGSDVLMDVLMDVLIGVLIDLLIDLLICDNLSNEDMVTGASEMGAATARSPVAGEAASLPASTALEWAGSAGLQTAA